MDPNPMRRGSGRMLAEHFRALSDKILRCELNSMQRGAFIREALENIVDFSGCDSAVVQLIEAGNRFAGEVRRGAPEFFHFETQPLNSNHESGSAASPGPAIDALCDLMLAPLPDSNGRLPGAFGIDDPDLAFAPEQIAELRGDYASVAVIPLESGLDRIGLLHLRSTVPGFFTRKDVEFYEGIGRILGIALAHRRSHALLRERVKELTCLYGIARVAVRSELSLPEILQEIVELLPSAWLYPGYASARIAVGGKTYFSRSFKQGVQTQAADLVVGGQLRGTVEVGYFEKMHERDEGPFLKEERSLIDTIARELGMVIQRREAEEEKARLQEQHADRLATLGQLSAGVAHEINEPLGSILGFAQLAARCPDLPDQARKDIDKIAAAALYTREVIRKLMLFAREAPSTRSRVDLNSIVRDAMTFFEFRCATAGIDLQRCLEPDLPEIMADPAQMIQVLVNLVVNAIQAMPKGGTLRISTTAESGWVVLTVQDDGVGMSKAVLDKIFVPFFTTKDVNEGTGLGLAVVHGIVSSHGGTITAESTEWCGSRFEIRLPVQEREAAS